VRPPALGSLRLLARALNAFPAVLVMIITVTVGLALLATTLPRAVAGVVSDIVRHDVSAASPLNRNLIATGSGLYDIAPSAAGIPAGMSEDNARVWGRLDDQLAVFRAGLPEPLRGTLTDGDFTVAVTPALSSRPGILPAALSLRYDPRYESRITMTAGRAPENTPAALPSAEPLEVIVAEAAAQKIEWSIGDARPLALDIGAQQVVLVGTFVANDPDASYWTQATATHRPVVIPGVPPSVDAGVFVDPVGFPAAVAAGLTFRSSVWFETDADAISADNVAAIATQTRQVAISDHQLGDSTMPRLVFTSGLPEVLEASVARSITTQAVLTMIIVSPIGLALTLEVLVARLAAERLLPSLALLAARGASRRQRLALVAGPALLLGLLAAAVGCAVGLALPGGHVGPAGVAGVLVTAVTPAALLALFTLRPTPTTSTGSSRALRVLRVGGEIVLLLATGAALLAALQRGRASDGAPAASVDLLSAAVPLLLSLLGCIVALRLYPVLVRRCLDVSRRARGIGAFVGLSRAIRGGTAGLVPLLAVILGVSVAVFSGVLSATLSTGLDTAAQTTVGADIALENVRLDQADLAELRTLDGVAAVAGIAIDRSQRFQFPGHATMSVSVGLVDSADLAAVQGGVPGRVPFDARLAGAAVDAVPVQASAELSETLAGASTARLNRANVTVVGAPLAGRQLTLSGNWVLVDRAHADSLDFVSTGVSTRVLVRLTEGADSAAVITALRAAVQVKADADTSLSPTAPAAAALIVRTPADHVAELNENPTVRDVHAATALAIIGAALITSLALALTLLLDGPARRATVARLSAVGLSRRQGGAIVRWEVAPLSVAGLLGGVVLGAALSLLVLQIVDLRPFTGGFDQPSITANPLISGGTALVFAAVFLGTGAVAARQATRRDRVMAPPAAARGIPSSPSDPRNPGRTS
jgi:putative ABC transport system permease protein